MNILHVITGLDRGGAELMLARLVRHHRQAGDYRHRIVSLGALGSVGETLAAEGFSITALNMRGPLHLPGAVRRLSALIRRERPDVVQCWMYHADLVGGLAARLAGCRNVIWGVRVADIFPAMGVARSTLLVRRLCAALSRRLPSRIVYVAESARRVHERLGYDGSKSIVIPNGYDFPTPPAAERFRKHRRRELALSDDGLLIGSAGRFSPQKGYRGLVQAAASLDARRSDARYLLVGREVERSNAELTGWLADHRVSDRFELLGERSDLVEWLAAMDVFVLNSLCEGFPNVVAEAMSVAVPCIVTDVGDAALLVGDTGIVIQPSDPEGLAAAMGQLAALAPEARRALGERARARVEENFSMPVIVRRFEALYEALVQPDARANLASPSE